MATISLTVTLTNGTTTTASITVADANVQRMATALGVIYPGKTNAQIVHTGLERLLLQAVGLTKNYERQQAAIADISLT